MSPDPLSIKKLALLTKHREQEIEEALNALQGLFDGKFDED